MKTFLSSVFLTIAAILTLIQSPPAIDWLVLAISSVIIVAY